MARFACLVSLSLLTLLLGCQEPEGIGTLMGQLASAQDGTPYINAEVRATSQATTQTAVTDTKGNYRFQQLPSGLYQVRASLGQKSRQTSTRVEANQVTRLNFRF